MATDQAIAEKPKRRARPRNKNGTFGKSEAQKRREANGNEEAAPKAAQIKPGIAKAIAEAHPDVPASIRQQTAQAVATINANARTLTNIVIDKLSQSLRKSEGLRIIQEGGPRAARYAMALVDGEYPEAPHAVRLQAAFGIMDMAGYRVEGGHDDKDLSELTLSELNQKVMAMEHRIDVATSIPGESSEVGNAAPLTPVSHETPSDGTPAQRQAIE